MIALSLSLHFHGGEHYLRLDSTACEPFVWLFNTDVCWQIAVARLWVVLYSKTFNLISETALLGKVLSWIILARGWWWGGGSRKLEKNRDGDPISTLAVGKGTITAQRNLIKQTQQHQMEQMYDQPGGPYNWTILKTCCCCCCCCCCCSVIIIIIIIIIVIIIK